MSSNQTLSAFPVELFLQLLSLSLTALSTSYFTDPPLVSKRFLLLNVSNVSNLSHTRALRRYVLSCSEMKLCVS